MRCTVKAQVQDAHDECAWTCCWVPGTDGILSGSGDETVKHWKSTSEGIKINDCYQGTAGYTLGVISVCVDPTGEWAASSALDSYVRVWSLKDHNNERALLESMPTEIWSIAFSPVSDKCIVAGAGGASGKIKLWDISALKPGVKSATPDPIKLEVHPGKESKGDDHEFLLSIAFSPDGTKIACASMKGSVYIFDTTTQQQICELTGHFKPIRSIAFTPDSKQILTACDDMQVHLYEVGSNHLIEAFSGHESWVLGVASHPKGSCFASCSSDNSVRLWDIGQRACIVTSKEHKDQVWSVAFNEEGSELASCGDDGKLITYSIQ